MKSASGRSINETSLITAENVREYAPSAEAVAEATEYFSEAGFEVAPVRGIEISISSKASAFEEVLERAFRPDERGGVAAVTSEGDERCEIPLTPLPGSIRALVVAITFTPPPSSARSISWLRSRLPSALLPSHELQSTE